MRTTLLVSFTIISMSGCGRPPAPVPTNSAFYRRCTEPDLRPLIDKHLAAKKLAFVKVSDMQGGIAEPGHLYSKKELEGKLTGSEKTVEEMMKSLLDDFKAIAAETGATIDVRLIETGADAGRRWGFELNYESAEVGGTVLVKAETTPEQKSGEKEFRLVMKIEDMFPNMIRVIEESKGAPPRR